MSLGHRYGLCLAALIACLSPLQAQQNGFDANGVSPTKKIYLSRDAVLKANPSVSNQAPPQNGIFFNGGPVILGTTNVYYIWYGNWSVDPNALPILTNFAQFDGGSPYFAINTTYTDANSVPISNSVSFVASTTDNYSQGVNLSDASVLAVVSSAITSGRLPKDTNAVYFVLTSPDVHETSGFISVYCGWHDHATIAGSDIKYSFVGDAATQGISSCAAQTTKSPNADPGADAMASVIAHELEEAVTDPDLNAWFDLSGNENADKCAWTFGATYTAANGSLANMNLGGRDYLIQRNWVNLAGGFCALSLGTAPTLTSIVPNNGQVNSAVPVTITGTNLSGGTINISGSGVTASNVVTSATQITATFNIAASATPGPFSVTATSAGGTSNALTFTVNSGPPPALSSIVPNTGTAGTAVGVTLTGTNLTGASVNAGAGITVSNVVAAATQVTATFTIAANAATGARNVTVTTAGGASNAMTFTVSAPGAPTITNMSPSSAAQGTSLQVTLTGTNFTPTSSVRLSGSGAAQSNVVVVSATQITVTFTFSATTALGGHNVSVVTAAGTSNVVVFTVTSPSAPALTSIAPTSGTQGAAVPVTLTGTNLSGASISALSGITASNVVATATQVTATFTIAANATVGPQNVTVTTSGGTSNAVTFTVNAAAPPALTLIAPTSGTQGAAVGVTLTGTNLTGASINALSGITVSNVASTATQVTATFTIAANAAVGPQNVTVTTSGGTSNSMTFTVNTPPAPSLTLIAPSSGTQGTVVGVTLTGTNLSGASINALAGITISNVASTATQVTATFTIAANAAVGPQNVTVTTAGGTSNAMTFTVNAAVPGLTMISPNSGTQGAAVGVTLTGTNLTGAGINALAGITISNVVATATQVSATFTIAANAAVGPQNVTVTTAGGTSNAVTFTVNAPGPGLTSISPSIGTQGTVVGVTLTGTNLSGASINALAGITISNVVSTATQVTATFTIAANAATGARNVTATTAGGTSNAVTFTVGAPGLPVITNMSPSSAARGTSLTVTLTGANFTPTSGVRLSGVGAAQSNVVVVSPTQITVTFTFSATTALGGHNVSVVTAAGTSNVAIFTVF